MQFNKLLFSSEGSVSVLQFKSTKLSKIEIKTLNELLKTKEVEICEVSDSGNVNNIIVNNLSSYFLFMLDGDILRGAKQNRILNTSVLVSPNNKLNIPVSCVESGRWSNYSRDFNSSEYTVTSDFRAKKSSSVNKNYNSKKSYQTDQSHIWDIVKEEMCLKKVISDSDDYEAVYKKHSNTLKDKFKPAEGANGMAIFYGTKILNADIFGTEKLYKQYFERIINAASLNLQRKSTISSLTEQHAINILHKKIYYAEESIISNDKAAGEGKEMRFENDKFSGFELTYNDSLIHYTLLSKRG